MVLQRAPQSATIWGTSAPGAVISAALDSMVYKVFADMTGNWTVTFEPQDASIGRTITLMEGNQKLTLTNIAFGDVFVCSGQSNMEFSVGDSFDNATAIPDSINYPNLRLFTIAKHSSLIPLVNTTNRWTDGSRWVVSAPQYVGGPSFNYFSATCYYFGRELYKAVNVNGATIPIGLIDTCYGGTRIEAWTTPQYLAQCGAVQSVEEFTEAAKSLPVEATMTGYSSSSNVRHSLLRKSNTNINKLANIKYSSSVITDPDPQTPSVLFNGMIAPILNMKVRGATWYQGESNSGNATNYACRFPAMIQDWRQQFNNYDLWFGFVLLAAYKEGGNPAWPQIRDAQLQALQLPLVHVSSAQDLGDEASTQGAIHPQNKTYVGARLAIGAQVTVYKQNVITTGPSVADIIWPIDSGMSQSVILRFAASSPINQGLSLRDTSQCDLCCKSLSGSALTVGTSDGQWRRAQVYVSSSAYIAIATVSDLPSGVVVTSVQHGYEDYQQCAIYNSVALPLLPFNITRS